MKELTVPKGFARPGNFSSINYRSATHRIIFLHLVKMATGPDTEEHFAVLYHHDHYDATDTIVVFDNAAAAKRAVNEHPNKAWVTKAIPQIKVWSSYEEWKAYYDREQTKTAAASTRRKLTQDELAALRREFTRA